MSLIFYFFIIPVEWEEYIFVLFKSDSKMIKVVSAICNISFSIKIIMSINEMILLCRSLKYISIVFHWFKENIFWDETKHTAN